jgi:hypothetical protein
MLAGPLIFSSEITREAKFFAWWGSVPIWSKGTTVTVMPLVPGPPTGICVLRSMTAWHPAQV